MSFLNISAADWSEYMNVLFDVGQLAHVCHSSSSGICATNTALLSPGLQEEVYESTAICAVRLHPYYQTDFFY